MTTIWTFTGGSDGAQPAAGLIADEAVDATGALYGTASAGGGSNNGVVFRLTPPEDGQTAWTEQTLWSFSGGSDGAVPFAGLIADERGALYGTTGLGGASNKGVVFKLTPPEDNKSAWTEQTLWSFSGGNDGGNPFTAGLVSDKAGALYGTTPAGGVSGVGVVFKLTPPEDGKSAWTEQTLWSFSGGSDGSSPQAGLIADGMRALYGTTIGGGSNNNLCFGANGVVFKLKPPKAGQTAWSEQIMWTFSGGSDGCSPMAPLIADERGAIYGTTQFGGAITAPSCISLNGSFGCGVVFRLTGTGFVPDRPD